MLAFPVLPPLHVGGIAPTEGPLYTHWILDPKVAVYVIGITALYLAWVGPLNRRRPGAEDRPVTSGQVRWFLLGSLALLIALGPPLDDWSHFFFSSAHMVQHLLLMFVVVPCWLKGIPAWVYAPILERRWSRWLLRTMTRVVPAFVLASLIIAVWHVPAFYSLALENDLVHVLQHQFFLVAGFLFFWPLMSRVAEAPPLAPPLQCLYLFLQTLPSGAVGAAITYAAPGLYPHYEEAPVRPWDISIRTDQQVGGLLMWVGMNTVFLLMLTVIFLRWAGDEERKDRLPASQRPRQRIAPVGDG